MRKKSDVAKHKAKDKPKPSLLDNPAMDRLSKKSESTIFAMSTRSKRRLNL
jgi:hypothetical protein